MAVYSTQRAEAKKKVNDIYDLQAEQVNKAHAAGVKEIGTAYDDQQRAVAVQKLINERKVAESMANLGLTDSGLNRTQQTAVQLSAANAAYNLNRQKQADISAYNLDRDSKLSTIEQNRISATAGVDETYDGLEAEYEAAQAKAAAEAAKATAEKQEKASYIIQANGANLRRDFKGSLYSNGVSVRYNSNGTTTYTDTKSGKSTTFDSSVNPYTGYNNATGTNDTAKAWSEYGRFDNGYQPKGVYENGQAVGKLNYTYLNGKCIRDQINGNMQNVGQTPDGRLWIWDGSKNKYLLYEE